MMKKRVFLFPTEVEASPFRRLAPKAEVMISGVGAAATAASVARALREGYESLVLAGIAGTYDDSLECGSVVAVSEEYMAGLPAVYAQSYRPSYIPKGLQAVTSNTVASCGAKADGARIENMEGGVFMSVCSDAGVEFCEVRAVSNMVGARREEWQTDTAVENLAMVLEKTFLKCSFMNKTKIILWSALGVIAFVAVVLLLTRWRIWLSQVLAWIIVIAVSFLAGWLIGRYGGKRGGKKGGNKTLGNGSEH